MKKLYLADATQELHLYLAQGARELKRPFRLLISYYYSRDKDLDALVKKVMGPSGVELFADSGAFSAWSQNKTLSVQEYGEWLLKWRHLFTVYANLDVKGDVDAGLRNQEYLESIGLVPLPVFHAGEPYSVLQGMINRYSYIALGGTAGGTSGESAQMRYLVKAFAMGKGQVGYHGFGTTRWSILKALPWYSTDSSSWSSGVRYGGVSFFSERKGVWYKGSLGNYQGLAKHADLLREYGFDWREFADRSQNKRSRIVQLTGMAYMKAEAYLQKLHGDIIIPHRPKVLNPDHGILLQP